MPPIWLFLDVFLTFIGFFFSSYLTQSLTLSHAIYYFSYYIVNCHYNIVHTVYTNKLFIRMGVLGIKVACPNHFIQCLIQKL